VIAFLKFVECIFSILLLSKQDTFSLVLFISGTRSFQFQDVFSIENEDTDDMTTLIDKKVRQICWEIHSYSCFEFHPH
jgi:hypothetical protein